MASRNGNSLLNVSSLPINPLISATSSNSLPLFLAQLVGFGCEMRVDMARQYSILALLAYNNAKL